MQLVIFAEKKAKAVVENARGVLAGCAVIAPALYGVLVADPVEPPVRAGAKGASLRGFGVNGPGGRKG